MKYHANAKLTLRARRELVERMQSGWLAGDIADQMNVSPATVYKWRRIVQNNADLFSRAIERRRKPNPDRGQ